MLLKCAVSTDVSLIAYWAVYLNTTKTPKLRKDTQSRTKTRKDSQRRAKTRKDVQRHANFCVSLSVFVCLCQLQTFFCCLCVSLCVFARLCPSLPVFACLCVVWVSLRYLDRPLLSDKYFICRAEWEILVNCVTKFRVINTYIKTCNNLNLFCRALIFWLSRCYHYMYGTIL